MSVKEDVGTTCYRSDNSPPTLRRIYLFLQRRFAPGRFRLLYETLDLTERTKVLDLGGTRQYWALAQELGFPLPKVTLVNVNISHDTNCDGVRWVKADVRDVPFKNSTFDVVVSNSLIEHLGDWGSQQAFAREVQRLAPSYFIQTPNRAFPVEPHYVAPFIHWLPKDRQRLFARNFTLYGILGRPSPQDIEQLTAELRLLSVREMGGLFAEGQVMTENVLGLPKSIIAYK